MEIDSKPIARARRNTLYGKRCGKNGKNAANFAYPPYHEFHDPHLNTKITHLGFCNNCDCNVVKFLVVHPEGSTKLKLRRT